LNLTTDYSNERLKKEGEISVIEKDGKVVMMNKAGKGIGSPNVCLTFEWMKIGDLLVPPGSILLASPGSGHKEYSKDELGKGGIQVSRDISEFDGFEFIRMSTLSIDPGARPDVMGEISQFYISNEGYNMSYDWMTIEIMQEFAQKFSERSKTRNAA
jgi:hypothetical protein